MQDIKRSTSTPRAVDNSDWLKTAAIILVAIDHFGYFFIEGADWWSVFGRMAAPVFFFMLGYARSRIVPLRWIWLGVILTLLDSWNNDWSWVAPNILLSLALIRLARPYVQIFIQRYDWLAFAILVSALVAVLPIAANVVEYGAEGWLWALFGLYQRTYVDGRSSGKVDSTARSPAMPTRLLKADESLMRLLACSVAAVVYVWQEQIEFSFSQIQFAALIFCIGVLSLCLWLFRRGPSRIHPAAGTPGRHSAFHRLAYPGNLFYSACRIRTYYKIDVESRLMTTADRSNSTPT